MKPRSATTPLICIRLGVIDRFQGLDAEVHHRGEDILGRSPNSINDYLLIHRSFGRHQIVLLPLKGVAALGRFLARDENS